jgi:hypothetical protein
LAGLKGNVKSVVTESAISMMDNEKLETDTRTAVSEEFYDKTGSILSDPKKKLQTLKSDTFTINRAEFQRKESLMRKVFNFSKLFSNMTRKGKPRRRPTITKTMFRRIII